jgi:hypothetical protein
MIRLSRHISAVVPVKRVRASSLVIAGVFIAGSSGLPLLSIAAPQPAAPQSATREQAVSGNPLWAIPLTSLSTTRERPIFSPSRRPPEPAAVVAAYVPPAKPPPEPPAEPNHPLLTLVGTIVGPLQGIGVFLDQVTQGTVRLRTGQAHAGWVLQSVRVREASFEKDQRVATLALPPPNAEQPAQVTAAASSGAQRASVDGGRASRRERNAAQAPAAPLAVPETGSRGRGAF